MSVKSFNWPLIWISIQSCQKLKFVSRRSSQLVKIFWYFCQMHTFKNPKTWELFSQMEKLELSETQKTPENTNSKPFGSCSSVGIQRELWYDLDRVNIVFLRWEWYEASNALFLTFWSLIIRVLSIRIMAHSKECVIQAFERLQTNIRGDSLQMWFYLTFDPL